MAILTYKGNKFFLDREEYTIISGAMHYFRIPREYWHDRLLKLKECGFNTVETYTCWNLHEPRENVFDFSGMLDLEAYIDIAKELGLNVILRPGPYICAEWEMGGLPAWLLNYPNLTIRCNDELFISKVERYYNELLGRIVPRLSTNGGNIIMMQIENEYGSYGDDSEYIRYLADGLRRRGINVPLFTSDGTNKQMLTGGTVPEIFKTANFGSRAEEQFSALREYQPDGPLMCTEFWNGWFDHWTEEHHHRSGDDAAASLDDILAHGGNVSAYMFHGGTNFGFMNGANCFDKYEPTVSSYDDDAPVNECGDLTDKYFRFREVISKYAPIPDVELPAAVKKKKYGKFEFTACRRLFDCLDKLSAPVETVCPLPMEKLGQGYGFILYRTEVRGPRETQNVRIQEPRDRAYIYKNDELLGVQYRNDREPAVSTDIPAEGATLSVLVENMGRVNYGAYLKDPKGVTEGIGFGWNFIYHWQTYPLPLDDLSAVDFIEQKPVFDSTPLLLRAEIDIDECCDTFVKLPGFKKGMIFINGRALSRYWEVGPQRSAYLPAPFLKKGKNELIVLELEGFDEASVILDGEPDLG